MMGDPWIRKTIRWQFLRLGAIIRGEALRIVAMFFLWIAMVPCLIFAQNQDIKQEESVIERALESVVGLYIERPMMEEYPQAGAFPGVGSGVIVDPQGLVLTNAHVVERATGIVAQLNDGTRTFAMVVGIDPISDVAVLQLEPRAKYPAIEVGQSSNLKIGSPVTAIGNPFGLVQSVTSGIVSGLHRSDPSSRIQDYIQLDAPINPGNSGGALIDGAGRLVGINSAIISPASSGNVGIGFAIPVEIAIPVYKQLVAHGHTSPGYLGVVSQNMSDGLSQALGLSSLKRGVIVTHIQPASPAAKAGLQKMDVITHLDGIPIHDSEHLRSLVVSRGQDSLMRLTFFRDGKKKQVDAITKRPVVQGGIRSGISGVYMMEHDEMSLDGARNTGLRVTQIEKDAPALLSGLLPNDLLVAVNGKKLSKLSDLDGVFSSKKSAYLLEVQRDNQLLYIALSDA